MSPTFLFVHLGRKLPKYLKLNLERTRRLFPTVKIVLVHDQFAERIQGLNIDYFEYSPAELSNLGLKVPRLGHNQKFWKGYWQNTFNRLFAIGAYQYQHQTEPVLHIESDVVVFKNAPIDKFADLDRLAWPRVSSTYDVASLVYSPSFLHYLPLMKSLIQIAKENPLTTDMQALSIFASKYPDSYIALPTSFSSDPSSASLQPPSLEKEVFGGIFDGLALGYWFCGRDSRDSWGIRRRYLIPLGSPLDFSSENFSVDPEGNLRLKKGIPVFSLHVHSKTLGYFKYPNLEFLRKEIELVNALRNASSFQLRGFYMTLKTHGMEYIFAIFSAKKWSHLIRRILSKK